MGSINLSLITMGPYAIGDPACGIDRPMGPRGARGARDSEAFETADGAPWGAWGPRVLGGEGPGGHGCCEGLAWGSGGWVGLQWDSAETGLEQCWDCDATGDSVGIGLEHCWDWENIRTGLGTWLKQCRDRV